MTDNPYGVTIGNTSATGTLNSQAITDMTSLGITWLRYQVAWNLVDATGTKNQDTTKYKWGSWDSAVSQCNAAGINIIITIFKAPTQFQDSNNKLDPTFTAAFAAQIATRYNGGAHGTVNAIEAANEDYDSSAGTSATPLVATLKAMYPAVKAVSASIKVGCAALLQRNSAHYTSFMETLLNPATGAYAGAVFQADYLNFHYYTGIPTSGGTPPNTIPVSLDPSVDIPSWNGGAGLPSFTTAWGLINNKMTQYGLTTPVWVTETGFALNTNPSRSTFNVVSQATQWSYLQAELDSARTSGVVTKLFVFTLGYFVYPNNQRDGMSLVQGTTASPVLTTAFNSLKSYITTFPTWSGGGGGGGGGGGTPLTVYFTGTASGTVPTANKLYTSPGGASNVNNTTALGTATGWGEITSQNTASAWAALSSAPNPSDKGFLLDSTILEGKDLLKGTYTASLRLNMVGAGAVAITSDIHARMYRRSSGGTKLLIADCALTAQIIHTTKTVYSLVFIASNNTSFLVGDKLYIDLPANVTANTGPAGTSIQLNDLSLETISLLGLTTAQVVTPGYANTSVILPSSDNPYGVTIELNPGCGSAASNYTHWTQLFADMATLGLTWLRFQLSWCSIQLHQADAPSVWSWGPLDDAVSQCNAAGINLLFTIRGAPTWALAQAAQQATNEPWYLPNSNTTADTNSMAYFAQQVCLRYNGTSGHGVIQAIGYHEDFNIHHTSTTDSITLNQAVNNGTNYSNLTVLATSFAVPAGTTSQFGSIGGTGQKFVVSVLANVGATSLTITAVGGGTFTASKNYSSGSKINAAWVGLNNSPYSEYNAINGVLPAATVEPSRDPKYAAPVVISVNPVIASNMPAGTRRGLPCLWWRNHPNTYDFIDGMYVGGISGAMYEFADYHHYSGTLEPMLHGTGASYTASFDQEWSDINAALTAHGASTKPIWVTEVGWQANTNTTSSTAVGGPGSATITVGSTVGAAVGGSVVIDSGGNQETVVITAKTSTTITAVFANAHAGTYPVVILLDCDEATQNARFAAVYASALASNIIQKMFFFTLDYSTSGASGNSLVYWNGSSYSYRQAFFTVQAFIANNPTMPAAPTQQPPGTSTKYEKSAVLFRSGRSKLIIR